MASFTSKVWKETGRRSPSSSPDLGGLHVSRLEYGINGAYSFSVAKGECVGITGASGIGKSLLLRAIADLDIHRGEVMLDGVACDSCPAPRWRSLVALVPAEPRWWHDNVAAHFPAGFDRRTACRLVEACGFAEDVLGWQVARLSTGEKQRLAVVRALIREPSALLLDETGSALDEHNGLLLESLIHDYRENRKVPVLWVSHGQDQLGRVAGRKMVLYRDRVEFELPGDGGKAR